MSRLFIETFVASLLALLIAGGMSHTHGQSQSGALSEEDEADIVESLLQLELKPFGSEFGNTRTFSSENIGSVSASRIAKHGFSLVSPRDIQKRKHDHVIEYAVIRSLHLKDGIVVVRLSAVTEGRPCFAPAFSRERSFTYEFQKEGKAWVGRLVKRPVPFPFSRSLATTP